MFEVENMPEIEIDSIEVAGIVKVPLEKVKSEFHLVEKEFTLLNGQTHLLPGLELDGSTLFGPIFDDFDRAKSTSLKKNQ